jgi:hypothetical protein
MLLENEVRRIESYEVQVTMRSRRRTTNEFFYRTYSTSEGANRASRVPDGFVYEPDVVYLSQLPAGLL